jgi:hypothetical protein
MNDGGAYYDGGFDGPPPDDAINPKDALGIKKAALRLVPQALRLLAVPAMALGADKYGPMNWRTKRVKLSVYLEALQRHIAAYEDGENFDVESGASHLSHAAACLGIIADAAALGMLDDDRMTPGPAAAMLADLDQTEGVTVREWVAKFGQHTGDDVGTLRMTQPGAFEFDATASGGYHCDPDEQIGDTPPAGQVFEQFCRDSGVDPVYPSGDVEKARAAAGYMSDPDEQIGDDPTAGYETTERGFVRKVEHPVPVRRIVALDAIDPKQGGPRESRKERMLLHEGDTVYTVRGRPNLPGGMIGFVVEVDESGDDTVYTITLPGMWNHAARSERWRVFRSDVTLCEVG